MGGKKLMHFVNIGENIMEQKRVTFEIAKAIKDAGYPQGIENTAWYNEKGFLVKPFIFNGGNEAADAPYYTDVLFWLWKEKKFFIKIIPVGNTFHFQILDHQYDDWHSWGILSKTGYDSPEDAIIGGVEYMVDNNLIK